MESIVGIGLLGCGTVGSNVADRLCTERGTIEGRSGTRYEVRGIAIRDRCKPRSSLLERHLFTTDARAIVDDPRIDVLIELIGGDGEAGDFVERALQRGRHVITANKDLLATRGPRLRSLAASTGAALRFEAAVAGAVPIVRTLSESLAGDEVLSLAGVINGTCTSVLSAMESGADFDEALVVAQQRGFAELDPANDIDGTDAAHKLAVLVQLAFGHAVISPRIPSKGIARVTRRAIARARMLGFRIRLVAAARRSARGVFAEVRPILVSEDHELGRTDGAENAVMIETRNAGRLVLRGAGAGGAATASAVLGDVVSILRATHGARDSALLLGNGPLAPAMEVEPVFAAFPHTVELPGYPIWEDGAFATSLPAAANE